MVKQAPRPNHSPVPKILVIFGIALLAIVTVFLIIQASQKTKTDLEGVENYEPPAIEETTPEPDAEPDDKEQPEAKPEAPSEPVAAPVRFLELGPDGQIMRGEFGTCLTPADESSYGYAELSFDSGVTWEPSFTLDQGALQILGAGLFDEGIAEMIALDELCDPMLLRSFSAGQTWAFAPDEAGSAWFLNPHDAAQINTPNGSVAAPCDAVQLSVSPTGENVAILCKDASVMTSTNGTDWNKAESSEPTARTVAIAATDTGAIRAATNAPNCNGLQISRANTATSCLETNAPDGQVAIAAYNDQIALWSEDSLLISNNGGVDWM